MIFKFFRINNQVMKKKINKKQCNQKNYIKNGNAKKSYNPENYKN